jgi:O-antigen/teichoic acid export membrane protein
LGMVPIILFAYLINGIYVIFSAGIYIEEKSLYVPFITGGGAAINIITNILLIPVFGIYGAALATLAAYLVMAIGYFIVTQKFYHIYYEWDKILKIFIGLLLTAVIYYLYTFESYYIALAEKLVLLTAFILYLYFIAVDRKEIKLIRSKLKESKEA